METWSLRFSRKEIKMAIRIFASIGVVAVFILAVSSIVIIATAIEVESDKRRYKKKLKSRFKGGPTAKCFCKDCDYYCERYKPDKYNHGAGDSRVHAGRRVQDNWYCWSATPVDYEEANRR